MAALFSPVRVLGQVLKTDPQTSRVLLAGLAVIACAAIVASWQITPTASSRGTRRGSTGSVMR